MSADEKQAYVYAHMLCPAVEKLQQTMTTESAISTVIAGQNEIMLLSDNDQRLMAAYLGRLLAK